ncbi:MAG: hypothetical protein AAGA48_12425 [Myxococcota bacterium]
MWGFVLGWVLGCDIAGPLGPGIGSEELLAGLVDLSQELEALERRVEALDAAPPAEAVPLDGCLPWSRMTELLDEATLRPRRPFGAFDGLVLVADGNLAEVLGLLPGDRLMSVQGWTMATERDRARLRRGFELDPPSLVTLEIRRRRPGDRNVDDAYVLTYRLVEELEDCLNTGGSAPEGRPGLE